MAITKILNIKSQSNLYNAIDYIMKPEKTKEQLWVGGNSGNTTQEVYRTMMDTKQAWGSWMEEKDTILSSAGNQENVRKKKPIRSFRNFAWNIWERIMIMCLESTRIGSIVMVILCSIRSTVSQVISIVMNVGTGKNLCSQSRTSFV